MTINHLNYTVKRFDESLTRNSNGGGFFCCPLQKMTKILGCVFLSLKNHTWFVDRCLIEREKNKKKHMKKDREEE